MSKKNTSGEEAIKILGQNEFLGNITPKNWYKNIRLSNGKPNLTAITILSEIVYWYRPSKSGEKKFAEDIWQCNYSYFEEEFGLSRKQILTAFECLEELDLVYREFRSIKVRGRSINNVLYIGLNADKVIELSGDTLSTSMEIGCDIKEESISTCKVTPISAKVKTNTKTISNNSTKITTKTNSTTGVAKKILSQFNLSERDIFNIEKAANGDIETIESAVNCLKASRTTIDNVAGFLICAIKQKYSSISYEAKSPNVNNNFTQRKYDYAELEKVLLAT